MKSFLTAITLLALCLGTVTAQQSVTSFTLINADTDTDIGTLNNGDVIDYSTLPTRNLNIRANTNPATVGSVIFSLDGGSKTENIPPYALAGDNTAGTSDYNALNPELSVGAHSLTATPYEYGGGGGIVGTPLSISFNVVDGTPPANLPPTANAGADKTLTLPTNSTTLNGSGSDPDGTVNTYLWTKESGPAATMSGASTPTLTLSDLVQGTYVFWLTVTDNDGDSDVDEVTVTVNPESTGGNEVVSFTLVNADNDQDLGPLTNGAVLDYATLPTQNLSIRANTNPPTVGSVVFMLDGGSKTESLVPYTVAGDNANAVPTDYYPISPALAEGGHTLSATPYEFGGGTGAAGTSLAISFTVVDGTPPPSNLPPTANAGADQTLTLPTNSTTLNGTGSDIDGTVTAYLWIKTSGPSATLTGASTPQLLAEDLVQGVYVFELTVTDDDGDSHADQATVTVNPASTGGQEVVSFTLVNADNDQDLGLLENGDILDYATLPTQNLSIRANTNPPTVGSVVLMLDGGSRTESLTPYTIFGDNANATPTDYYPISPVLAEGAHTLSATPYEFGGGTGAAGTPLSITFSVVDGTPPPSNIPPVANAGANQTLTLPTNSTTLNGTGSDVDGTVTAYLWTKASGPSATLTGASTPQLLVEDLVQGVYVFELTVTDNDGDSHSDEATVTVNPASTGGQEVISFTLINADNNQDIGPLENGDVIDYDVLPTQNLSIRANTSPSPVGSVVFSLDGNLKTESVLPYAIAGDNGNPVNYNPISPPMIVGTHNLSATPYDAGSGTGNAGTALAISFTVTGTAPNASPTANAGSDKFLILPSNSTTLNGSSNDTDGSVVSHLWTKQSGPSATLSGANTPTLSLSNLVQGTYVFRLTVTDDDGATGFDDATVTVSTSGGGGGTCAVFNEVGGLVVIEMEALPTTSDWSAQTSVGGFTGSSYYEWRTGDNNGGTIGPGSGILSYAIQINTPGRYKLKMRSAAPHNTEHNDVWIRFAEGNGVALGSGVLNLGSSWFKCYQNASGNNWTWSTNTKDHDAHEIYVDFNSAGTYHVDFSGRSTKFKIDRFVLFNVPAVGDGTAENTGNPQSPCAGGAKRADLISDDVFTGVVAYPNPTTGDLTMEFTVAQTGKTSLQLFDVVGNSIGSLFEGNLEAGTRSTVNFNGSELGAGLYFIQLRSADKVVTRQVIFH